MIRITKGLDLPIAGEPRQTVEDAPRPNTVALLARDYVGMKPTMAVREGDDVRLGQTLFADKRNPAVKFASPATGRVVGVNRGAKRVFQSVVVELTGAGDENPLEFRSWENADPANLTRDQVVEGLTESGLWTALRQRPFSRIPAPESAPHSLFVTAIDTNPLAVDPAPVIQEHARDFVHGLQALRQLTAGPLYLCKRPGVEIPGGDLDFVRVEEFDGPHPAGLPGTHIHFLDPVSLRKTVWHINYPDVIAFGKLFTTGTLWTERVIALAGPAVKQPRLLRTRLGASIPDIAPGEFEEHARVISGSVLSGRRADPPNEYLGRYDLQISAVPEESERVLLGWQDPGFDKFSIKRIFASAFTGGGKKFRMTTTQHGSKRAMVPIGTYERVMPLDVIPTFLLRSLITGDMEQAQLLGCLELDEEDLALCTFVCPGKYEYAPLLRRALTTIEKEG
ncbi:MAG: Na(+)-translocating NADH-quinone reductase subunit A [Planctomycetaceae bacterium]